MNRPDPKVTPAEKDGLAQRVQDAPEKEEAGVRTHMKKWLDENIGGEETIASQTVMSFGRGEPDGEHLKEGEKIGRYVVLKELGAGGMGVVYSAYDPELDRKIALKLLRPDSRSAKKETAKFRLLREAQAMAKLDHPNVIPVHDVGTIDESVFLAMEFIDGKTLGDWTREENRKWDEILPVFEMAGRGLAAAHDKGIVHRDFKPDNVMVGDDGRIRVMDFGLARPSQDEIDTPNRGLDDHETVIRNSGSSIFNQNITHVGAVMGTPAYMSPEQMSGQETDSRTDQFSFCVALWEALYNERPFKGETFAAMNFNVTQGHLVLPKDASRAPRWLRKVLIKGLQTNPEDRFENMPALLEAFAKGHSRSRMRKVFLGIAGGAALAGVGLGGHRMNERQKEENCIAMGKAFSDRWQDEQKEKVREGLLATGESYSESSAQKVMPWLDTWADSWAETRTETCMANDVLGVWDEELLAKADECLEERQMRFDALVAEMSEADSTIALKAVGAAAGLPDAESCGEERYLEMRPGLPSGSIEEAKEIRQLLSRSSSLIDSGKYKEAKEVAESALKEAEMLGHLPLTAEARATLGVVLRVMGDYDSAEAHLSEAYLEAGTSGASEVAVYSATKLVYVTGYKKAHFSEGMVWGRAAEVALKNMNFEGSLREASLLSNMATVQQARGDYEKAAELHQRALDIREAELDENHPSVAVSLNNMAVISQLVGKDYEAKKLHERALAIRENVLGPEHPEVGYSLSNLAAIHQNLGDFEEARAIYERVSDIWEKSFDPTHPNVGANMTNLGLVLSELGELEEARKMHQQAIEIFEASLGPDHPMISHSLQGLAVTYLKEGEPSEALAYAERASRLREGGKAPGEEYAEGLFVWAKALWEAPKERGQDREKALRLARQAKALYEESGKRPAMMEEIYEWLSER